MARTASRAAAGIDLGEGLRGRKLGFNRSAATEWRSWAGFANSTIRIAFLAVVTDRTGGGFNDVPFTAVATINVVPEPSGVALALAGGISMIAALRRRKR